MSGTYTQLLYHIVFSTRQREPWITADVAERLYPYIGGIIREHSGVLYAINGIEDHVHLFIRWRTDETLANLMREVKTHSSKWIHQTFPKLHPFAWQEGYSAFTVSQSQVQTITHYIASQKEHHQKFDFKAELIRLLEAHQIEYNPKYVFD